MNKYFSVIFCLLSLVLLAVIITTNKAQISTASSKTSDVIEVPELDAEKLFNLINQWRNSEGREIFTKDDRICELTNIRANDTPLDNHKGFVELMKKSTLPSKMVFEENLAFDWSEQKMLDGWLTSASHAATLRKDYKYSCVSCKGNYCVQIFSNL